MDSLPEAEVIECVSVGWLVHDDESVKMHTPNMGDIDSENNMQASGIIRIPVKAITRIARLSEDN